MTLIVPPLLSQFTSPSLLEYSGGPQTVAHVMDWREMAARPAVNTHTGEGAWKRLRGAWAGGKKVGQNKEDDGNPEVDVGPEPEEGWDYGVDDRRGWLIGLAWITAAAVE